MTPGPDPKTMQYTALQLAWLHELGIDKPWIPGDARAVAPATPATPKSAEALAPSVEQSVQTQPIAARADSEISLPGSAPVRAAPRATGAKHAQAVAPMSAVSIAAMTALTSAAAGAAPDLQSLAGAANACQTCGLCRERTQVVMGQGMTQPAIMVIGDGPGEQEDRQGLPFMAESGLLLDQMLATIDSARTRDVYLANVVKCRPPGNRLPRPDEIAACRPYLLRQFELVRPFSILALGRVAAQSLLNTEEPLQNLRGRVHQLEIAGQQIPLVVSYHTGHLLNHPADKAAAWQDLQLLRTLRR